MPPTLSTRTPVPDPYGAVRAAVARFTKLAGAKGRPSGNRIPPGMIGITITDDARTRTRGLDRIFDAFGATIDDLPQVLDAAVPTIREAHRRVFATEGAAGRGKWAPLAPATLRDRARKGFGPGPIHVRTGALRDHVLTAPARITRSGSTVELRIRPDDNVGGVPKYRALALGTDRIPARPMVALGPGEATAVTSTIQRAFRARAQAHGLG